MASRETVMGFNGGVTFEERKFNWKIQNFEMIAKSEDLVDQQKVEFQMLNLNNIRSAWKAYLSYMPADTPETPKTTIRLYFGLVKEEGCCSEIVAKVSINVKDAAGKSHFQAMPGEAHQVQEHSREKPHRCSECPETFMDKVTLQKHLINAHGAAKLKCPYCPKEFASQAILSSHINLHEGISFPCDKCDKVFGNRGKLTTHQYVHKTTKDFICEECGKAFRSAKLLKIHLQIHIGDKKHKCSYCPKAFVMRTNLISHERIHTGEKPYVCESCGKDFNQRSALNVHMKTQHKELISIKNKSEVTATGST